MSLEDDLVTLAEKIEAGAALDRRQAAALVQRAIAELAESRETMQRLESWWGECHRLFSEPHVAILRVRAMLAKDEPHH